MVPVPSEIGQKLCGILGVCWSGGYKTLEDLASALERVAADCRNLSAKQKAEYDGDRIIG